MILLTVVGACFSHLTSGPVKFLHGVSPLSLSSTHVQSVFGPEGFRTVLSVSCLLSCVK